MVVLSKTRRPEQRPGAKIVCRDRDGAYAEAVHTAAPDAVQVTDRFHVWRNVCDAVEKCVLPHLTCPPSRPMTSCADFLVSFTQRPELAAISEPACAAQAPNCRSAAAGGAIHAGFDGREDLQALDGDALPAPRAGPVGAIA
ncbi:hypothetical protein E1295_18295 [Nonomuraea mesophila]|uniref:Transposase IS204/IS1001/IS1096/IS1165 DDE domain-containing protein n=1 Tax=Nonomuraea mesophila TaxID=2530382 RepID=A0A4R5FIJ8_9ACTN|nr:hypothetical protein E1295_18295 [Nonomuraea mesophila]